MWVPAVEAAFLGGLLCLDRIVVQVMLSRPIVSASLVGASLGDPATGLIAGAMVELLWIDRFPMGRYLPPNDTTVAVLVSAGSIVAGNTMGCVSKELITLAVLLFAPAAYVAQAGDRMIARSNDGMLETLESCAEKGDIKTVARKHRLAMVKTFIMSATLIFILLVPGIMILEGLFPLLTERIIRTLNLAYHFVPIVGIAVALSTIKIRGTVPIFSGLFLVAVVLRGLL